MFHRDFEAGVFRMGHPCCAPRIAARIFAQTRIRFIWRRSRRSHRKAKGEKAWRRNGRDTSFCWRIDLRQVTREE